MVKSLVFSFFLRFTIFIYITIFFVWKDLFLVLIRIIIIWTIHFGGGITWSSQGKNALAQKKIIQFKIKQLLKLLSIHDICRVYIFLQYKTSISDLILQYLYHNDLYIIRTKKSKKNKKSYVLGSIYIFTRFMCPPFSHPLFVVFWFFDTRQNNSIVRYWDI